MANEYLQRTPTSTGNRKVWTWSGWIKRNVLTAARQGFFGAGGDGANVFRFGISATSENIMLSDVQSSTDKINILTTPVNRDTGNWIHVLLKVDTTNPIATSREEIYINGVLLPTTHFTDASLNLDTYVNVSAVASHIGRFYDPASASYKYLQGEMTDVFFIDGQALTPEVFGFYKDGNGYISAGSTQSTDFRNGQWVPRTPREIKNLINDNGGFGVNGFYLPMNDSSNFGADFHTTPNSIITLKGENLPQPRNGAPETTDAYVSQLREDPYAANLVLAVPGISTATGPNLVSNGTFYNGTSGWTVINSSATLSVDSQGRLQVNRTGTSLNAYLNITTEIGKRYTLSANLWSGTGGNAQLRAYQSDLTTQYGITKGSTGDKKSLSFTALETTTSIIVSVDNNGTAFVDNIVVRQENAPLDYSADIKGSGTNKTLTANGNAGVGYEIPSYYGSALSSAANGGFSFEGSDFAFGTGDFTFEGWFYISSDTSVIRTIFDTRTNDNNQFGLFLGINDNDNLYTYGFPSGTSVTDLGIPAINQWHHVAVERNGSIGTVYLNGVAVSTVNMSSTNYTQSGGTLMRPAAVFGDLYNFYGYVQDFRVYKGVAKYKGGFDVPKPYTPVGIATWRAVPDTCQNNFATLNPLEHTNGSTTLTFSEGNTRIVFGGTGYNTVYSTVGVTTGKYYFECRYNTEYVSPGIGVNNAYPIIRVDNGNIYYNDVLVETPSPQQPQSVGQIYGIALDRTNSSVQFYINDSAYGSSHSFSASDKEVFAHVMSSNQNATSDSSWNFGQNPSFGERETAGTYTDSNGKGLFKYQPPSGFLALCEDNLPTPTIKDPGEYFKTVLYTGTGASRNVVGVGFTPDLVWVKSRTNTEGPIIFDSVRGPEQRLLTATTSTEATSAGGVMSFDEDGYSTAQYTGTNQSGQNYVAWCWRAGGPAVRNTDGSIISQVSVNQDDGFSIVSYTGNGSTGSVGHGLGKAPKFIIYKNRDSASNWLVNIGPITGTTGDYVYLNSTAGKLNSANVLGASSSVLNLGNTPESNEAYKFIAYCWAEIEGFSKFGSYVGNGSTDGPFVYCGFKPAWVMIKVASGGTGDWEIHDSSRAATNPSDKRLYANLTNIEDSGVAQLDFLSNGFKIRTTFNNLNVSGETIIFAAFAESPFKYANSK